MLRMIHPVLFALTFIPGAALAQRAAERAPIEQPRHYEFDEDLVEGTFARPGEELIRPIRHLRFTSLVKSRADFLGEMRKSAENLP